ncbi:DUF58 domain-containing protein [Angustibacter speluncae]
MTDARTVDPAAGRVPVGRLLADLAPPEALRALELAIVRRLEGYLRGEHLGLLPGPGSELAEARMYRPGEDDVRHMDWAVTARTTQPHVRDVVADRELETYALVDLSGSMQFGTSGPGTRGLAGRPVDKRDLAVAAVATVGVLTGRVGDRFGGYVLSDRGTTRHPARAGRLALASLLRSLLEHPRHEVDPGAPTPGLRLGPALDAFGAAHPRRGLRVVVSDFLEPGTLAWKAPAEQAPEWSRPLRKLAVRHQVLAVEVVDPREGELPDVGVVDLVDPETGETLEVDTGRPATREAFAAAAAAHRDRVRRTLRQAGVGHLVLRTDSDWVADTARFVLAHRVHAHHLHAVRRGA